MEAKYRAQQTPHHLDREPRGLALPLPRLRELRPDAAQI